METLLTTALSLIVTVAGGVLVERIKRRKRGGRPLYRYPVYVRHYPRPRLA